MAGETDERLDAGFVYTPRWRPKDAPKWAPKPGSCCAGVHDGGRSACFHQCSRRAKCKRDVLHHGEPVTLEYCAIHDPVVVKRKREKWRTDFDAKMAQEAAQRREAEVDHNLKIAALDAIHKIAAGHNDPRALAMEVLSLGDAKGLT